ncbi:alpha/beta family hydrolase [Occultella aeris]|uniref:Alpha/beta hydrolase family protein n=1 Tax=Occultella aeris TaxID=2761496 RepID=A0A7M4DNH6_9MICO|nr:Alpha/beta hydrolase family protein [Occultella aeris]
MLATISLVAANPDPIEIVTSHGPARVHPRPADGTARIGALLLGHGAGGGVGAPDLMAATSAARTAGLDVYLVEQPYRVAGRRAPAPARQLDTAWLEVLEHLRADLVADVPLVVGGRSSGARVACRTAADGGARGVLCLAFPLHPPGRAADPSKSRLPELEAVSVPVLIVQGERDPFGMPPAGPGRTIVTQPGDHSLKGDLPGLRAAVGQWLSDLLTVGT